MSRSALFLAVAVSAPAQVGLSQELAPLLPSGWCSVVEAAQPSGEVPAAASTAAASLRCDGTCAVDVAFSYYPAAIDGGCWWFSETGLEDCPAGYTRRRANTVGELRRYLAEALALVNAAYQASGVCAATASYWWAGWPSVIAHEFGHNIGLAHGPEDPDPSSSLWAGGNGFRGRYVAAFGANLDGSPNEEQGWYGTIMATWSGDSFARFSTAAESLYGRHIGDRNADASAVLRRNVPYLAARANRQSRSVDYGCPPNECVDAAGRFLVSVSYRTADSASPLSAERLCRDWGERRSVLLLRAEQPGDAAEGAERLRRQRVLVGLRLRGDGPPLHDQPAGPCPPKPV